MQYGVPQFIDVEDKIVGPLTGKQTVYLIIGGVILMLVFTFFDFIFFALVFLVVAPITLAFAFWKPKGITVARWISNFINFHTAQNLYVWRREPETIMFKLSQRKRSSKEIEKEDISKSRIRELAWVLDTSTSVSMPYEAKERPGK
jgi:hypothetical protein